MRISGLGGNRIHADCPSVGRIADGKKDREVKLIEAFAGRVFKLQLSSFMLCIEFNGFDTPRKTTCTPLRLHRLS